jgi:hypothetical protein
VDRGLLASTATVDNKEEAAAEQKKALEWTSPSIGTTRLAATSLARRRMALTGNGNSEAGHDITGRGDKRKLRVRVGWVRGLRVPRWELADDKA